MDAKLRIKQLVEELNRYSEEYYIYDSPTVSDFEYDALLRELEDLEKANEKLMNAVRKLKEEGKHEEK